jgi:hypothetical protein
VAVVLAAAAVGWTGNVLLVLVAAVPWLLLEGARRPKLSVLAGVAAVLATSTVAKVSAVESLQYLDEAGVAFVLAATVLAERPHRTPGLGRAVGWSLFGFTLMAVVSTLANPLAPGTAPLVGLIAYVKPFGLAWAASLCSWSDRDLRLLVRFMGGIVGVVLLGCLADQALGDTWREYLAVAGTGSQTRYGLTSLIGPFVHPGALAQVAALLALTAGAASSRPDSRWSRFAAIAMVAVAILSLRRKVLLGLVLGFAVLRATSRHAVAASLLVAAVVVPFVVAPLTPALTAVAQSARTEYLEPDPRDVPRILLYQDARNLAVAHFPLGVGLGRFASAPAATNYSAVYDELGYREIFGLRPRDNYLTDTFWPAVGGETGFGGLLAYLGALVLLVVRAGKRSRAPQWLRLGAVACAVEFFIESLASPNITAPPSYAIPFALLGVLCGWVGDADEDSDRAVLVGLQRA